MARTRIKICGITRVEDAILAAEHGFDAIGLNFVGGPRKVSLEDGDTILHGLRPVPIWPTIVALCGHFHPNPNGSLTAGQVKGKLDVDHFQVYGRSQALLLEDDDLAPSLYWLVCPIGSREDITKLVVDLNVENLRPQALVLDTGSAEKLGGTGRSFDWNWIAEARDAGELEGLPPIILAGGLTAENVAEAIRIARPYAVDVSSGVEVAGRPGVKDPLKMRDFIQAVRGADT